MVDLAEVLRQLQTTNRNVGGGGVMGLTEAPALPRAAPVDLPQPPSQVPTDVHGLPQLPPLRNEPQLTAGYLPTWGEAATDAATNIVPQIAEAGQGLGGMAASATMQGGIAPALLHAAAQRYGTGTWRDAFTQAGEDFAGIIGAIKNEPSRLYNTYTDSGATRQKLGRDPLGVAMDATYVIPEARALRMLSGRTADELLVRGLQHTPIQPPVVQGMLPEATGVTAESGALAPPQFPWPAHPPDVQGMPGEMQGVQGQVPAGVVPGMAAPDLSPMQAQADRAQQLGRIVEEQNVTARQEGTPSFSARSMPDWRLDVPPEPGPRTIDNMKIADEIRALQSRRAYTTNDADRAMYDKQIKSLSEQVGTPDYVENSAGTGMNRFVREDNPADPAFPFRKSREPDLSPSELGLEPPGEAPGFWAKDAEGKRNVWIESKPPDPPTPRTIRRELGSNATGYERVHWEPVKFGSGPKGRGWMLVQDADTPFGPKPGEPMPVDMQQAPQDLGEFANDPLAQAAQLAGGGPPLRPPAPPMTPYQIGLPSPIPHRMNPPLPEVKLSEPEQFDRLLVKLNAAEKAGVKPMDPLRIGAVVQRQKMLQEARFPAAPESLPQLPWRDPAFHPRPSAPALRPESAAYIAKPPVAPQPEGILGRGPFDPKGERQDKLMEQARDKGHILYESEKAQRDYYNKTIEPKQADIMEPPVLTENWTPKQEEEFRVKAPMNDWQYQIKNHGTRMNEVSHEGGNQSWVVDFNGDESKPFFVKRVNDNGSELMEVAASEAGKIMGVEMLPAAKAGEGHLVTPFLNLPPMYGNEREAVDIILGMAPADRDRKLLFEFVLADADRHSYNYLIDMANDKLVGIDYGQTLMGDHGAMLRSYNRNEFYMTLRREVPYTEPLDRKVLNETVAKEEELVQHFHKAGATPPQIRRLRERFQMLHNLSLMRDVTYETIHAMIEAP